MDTASGSSALLDADKYHGKARLRAPTQFHVSGVCPVSLRPHPDAA